MNIHYAKITVAVALVLSGCAPVTTKLMLNPQTGDVKECKRDPWKNWTWEERAVLKACVEEYRKLGYVEAGDSTTGSATPFKKDASPTTLTEKLAELKAAKDRGLLTDKEYEEQRAKVMQAFSESSNVTKP